MAAETLVYLDIYIGDKERHSRERAEYDSTSALLSKNAVIYGLPDSPPDLNEEQQDILRELDVQPFHHLCRQHIHQP